MEEIQNQLEALIDDIERDSQLTRDEIHDALIKLKTEIEDHQLRMDEGGDLQWDDLD